jgi:hypothetical protein
VKHYKSKDCRVIEKVKEAGFDSIDDFVKANVHYLSEEKQKLFYGVIGFAENGYNSKVPRKINYESKY